MLVAPLSWCLSAPCRAMLQRRHQQEMQDLQDIAYAMKLRFSEQESEALVEFQGLVDEIKNKVGQQEGRVKEEDGGRILKIYIHKNMLNNMYVHTYVRT